MKRYANTKKFLLWFTLILLLLFVIVIAWRSLKRSSEMRPKDTRHRQTEQPAPSPTEQTPQEADPLEEESETREETISELTENPLFGWPASPFQVLELVEFQHYALGYHEQHEQAAWVAYRLKARENAARHDRYDRFMADEKVSTGSASPSDYTNSGYDRGHLAPAADFSYDKRAMQETFYMSNMSPQEPAFNRGVWSRLENQIRDWSEAEQMIWVVTGPVLLNQKNLKKIGDNQVSVPLTYYKVVLDMQEPTFKMVGFLVPNEGSNQELSAFGVTVDSIEQITGLDFFPLIPDELEERLESRLEIGQWKW